MSKVSAEILSRKMPIGIQSFENLRKEGYLYVDKTAYVYRLVTMGKPYFLSRPRCFGKSLLLSTFEAYFEGKKELFTGLAIEQLEQEWNKHVVLRLDLSMEKYDSRERLYDILERQLQIWEELYDTGGKGITHSGRFMEVIRKAYEKSGRGVVVLIDEYDKPFLCSFHNEELQNDFRETLTAFYAVLKNADLWLRFVFVTGITKFAQDSFNQVNDVSFDKEYAALCGMTREEIESTFLMEMQSMARTRNKTEEEIQSELARMYGGYRFSEYSDVQVYNPFSVLCALSKDDFCNYGLVSGMPSFLIEMLKETRYDFRNLEGIEVPAALLTDNRADINNPVPMIYQSGYLTIKTFDEKFQLCTLGYPNEEVRDTFYAYMQYIFI